ncbi:hypothetical protein KR222_004029 [Zaprionus bogoriensis]|nr:hypothetical protein KR222_004029 [Zaprionus bogoriensis]
MVSTLLGTVRGTTLQSFEGRKIYAFRGIPYGQPPVGDLRFEAPKAVRSWGPGVLNAVADSLICPQRGITQLMSEDCLKLNVFTRNFTAESPVIVYIHGGANVLGSGHSVYEAGPEYLLDHDVVLVAINYRLGALGFLHGGNQGYLDQVLALEWVQAHILHFGGDPDLVTIMGMSAGAMAVSLHLVSPLSSGLFHRAILMSGSATNHFSIHNLFWTRLLARQVGCPMYDTFDTTECLRNISWQRIVEVCAAWEQYKFVNMKWNYEIDGYFIPRHPSLLIDKGEFNRVPLLVTYTSNELDYSTLVQEDNSLLLHDMSTNFHDYAPELFLFDYNPVKSKRIRDYYIGRKTDEPDVIEKYGQIFSDAIIGHGVHRLVELARKHTPVYYSRMEYVGQRSLSAPMGENGEPIGVAHADDLQYVMPSLWYGEKMDMNHTDVFMMVRMTEWFTQFARTGKPTEDTQQWPPCTATRRQQLSNNIATKLGPPSYTKRYAVWDQLFPKPTGGASAQGQLSGMLLLALTLLLRARLM